MQNIKDIFEKTLLLVKECGKILESADTDKSTNVKNDGSLVTKYDLQIDSKLTEGLKEIANYPILSEEHEEKIGSSYFIIDPIDGTHNFNAGLEYYGIVVALIENDSTLFSIVHLPNINKTYTAIKGEGAYLNNRKINVRSSVNKLIGVCPMIKDTTEIIKDILNYDSAIDLRSFLCASAELCYLASGVFDFYYSKNLLGLWDFIGPKLIIEEAGGILEYKLSANGKYEVAAGTKETIEIIKKIVKLMD